MVGGAACRKRLGCVHNPLYFTLKKTKLPLCYMFLDHGSQVLRVHLQMNFTKTHGLRMNIVPRNRN